MNDPTLEISFNYSLLRLSLSVGTHCFEYRLHFRPRESFGAENRRLLLLLNQLIKLIFVVFIKIKIKIRCQLFNIIFRNWIKYRLLFLVFTPCIFKKVNVKIYDLHG